MQRHLRARFWVEASLTTVWFVLAILTIAWNDWVEEIFHVDPDAGNGSFEWAIVGIFGLLAVVFFVATRVEWRRSYVSLAATKGETA